MPRDSPTGSTRPVRKSAGAGTSLSPVTNGRHGYTVPLLPITVPESVVNAGFWAALAGAALMGSVDPPLAVFIGAAVIVARHRNAP